MNFKHYLLVLHFSSIPLFFQANNPINQRINPITIAIKTENPSAHQIKQLISKHIPIEEKALKIAIDKGYIEIVKILLNSYNDINEQDLQGDTLLMWAIKKNHIHAVKLILQAGADVNIPNNDKETPLIRALGLPLTFIEKNANKQMIQLLINHDADVNYSKFEISQQIMTPLTLAIELFNENGSDASVTIVFLLLKHGAIPSLLNINQCKNSPLLNSVLNAYVANPTDTKESVYNAILDTYKTSIYWQNINIDEWFNKNEKSLKKSILNDMYQKYLHGNTAPLENLLSNPNTPLTIQEYFTPEFITKIKNQKTS